MKILISNIVSIQSLDNMLRILSTSTNLNEKELELVNACRKHVEDLEFKYKNRSELLYRFAKQLHDIKL